MKLTNSNYFSKKQKLADKHTPKRVAWLRPDGDNAPGAIKSGISPRAVVAILDIAASMGVDQMRAVAEQSIADADGHNEPAAKAVAGKVGGPPPVPGTAKPKAEKYWVIEAGEDGGFEQRSGELTRDGVAALLTAGKTIRVCPVTGGNEWVDPASLGIEAEAAKVEVNDTPAPSIPPPVTPAKSTVSTSNSDLMKQILAARQAG